MTPFLICGIVLSIASVAMLAVLLRRLGALGLSSMAARLETLEKLQARSERDIKDEIGRSRQEAGELARDLRAEVQGSLKMSSDSLLGCVDRISTAQQSRLDNVVRELNAGRTASEASNAQARVELTATLNEFRTSLQRQMFEMAGLQKQQLDAFGAQLTRLTESNEQKSEQLRTAVDNRLRELQADNAVKLEEMRRTVDEKLQGTLDKRLGDSFRLVSERLEMVHKGLGEMQTLANGVGDLKRVLTNVKTRGTWGEVQLGNMLEQMLTSEQYARNVRTRPHSNEVVEFAVRLPGQDGRDGQAVWLPIDAKFPKEDYERLVDAAEIGDVAGIEQASKDLESRVCLQAREIRDRYIEVPHTTDFAILYLATEGLYAEVLRRPGLVDAVQQKYRVLIVGPTNLAALLNSLQMGFRTLAIQQRSSEVWKVLGAVKTEFGKFSGILDKVKKKLDETGSTIEEAAHRSRQLERKLKTVEALPTVDATALLEGTEACSGYAAS